MSEYVMVICDHTKIFLQCVMLLPTLAEMLTVLRAMPLKLLLWRVQTVKMDMDYIQEGVTQNASVSTD